MYKDVRFLTAMGLMSGLLVMSSVYLTEFQRWLSTQHQQVVEQPLPVSVASSIKILSNPSTSLASTVNSPFAEDNLHSIVNQERALQHNHAIADSQSALVNSLYGQYEGKEYHNVMSHGVSTTDQVDDANQTQQSQQPLPFLAELERELLIEFPASYSYSQKKHAISRLLTLHEVENVADLLENTAINTRAKPHYYQRVLNELGQAIRYPAQASRYADFLLKNHLKEINEQGQTFKLVAIPLHKPKLPQQIEKYHGWAEQYAKQFNVPVALVLAIMKTESGFNPRAVSKSNALGLLQIKQLAAGKDVYRYVDQKQGYPSRSSLFNPQENIRIGVAYMGLLNDKYLAQIQNPESKELLMIASYNGGLSKALRLFGETPEKAVLRINQLYPKNIYRQLRMRHQSAETRAYIDKVLKHKKEYSELLRLAA